MLMKTLMAASMAVLLTCGAAGAQTTTTDPTTTTTTPPPRHRRPRPAPDATPATATPPATTTPATPATPAAPPTTPAARPQRVTIPAGTKVNLNTATAPELDALPSIGKARLKVIMTERAKGNYKDWADFETRMQHTSVNAGVRAKIKDLVTF